MSEKKGTLAFRPSRSGIVQCMRSSPSGCSMWGVPGGQVWECGQWGRPLSCSPSHRCNTRWSKREKMCPSMSEKKGTLAFRPSRSGIVQCMRSSPSGCSMWGVSGGRVWECGQWGRPLSCSASHRCNTR
eukprot:521220_1